MVNRLYFFLLISLYTFGFNSSNWYFENDNSWSINTSSRSSALGGVKIDQFSIMLSKENYDILDYQDQIKIHNSSMYDDILQYNNISYHKNTDLHIFGNHIRFINFSLLNRKIHDISNTTEIWNDEFSPPSNPGDINTSLIEYYNHNDFCFSIFIPVSNFLGEFALDIKPGFSKIGTYSSKSINLDLNYFYISKSKDISLGIFLNNFFSYKIWNNDIVERFYPSLSILMNYQNDRMKNLSLFIQIDEFYFDSNYLEGYNIDNNITIGLEYTLNHSMVIRSGYNKNYYSMGFGVTIFDILFDYAYLNHQFLGTSNQITLSFSIFK